MAVLKAQKASTDYKLINREEPQLYRDLFPYKHVGRVTFDDIFVTPRPANPMFITDTTFRDGQQARPPYKPRQIADIFTYLHELGGRSGLIRAAEFFMYSDKDRKAIELCRAKDYRFPQVTGWIRANVNDLKIARGMEFKEVGMLTSVSDYHIYLKLGWDRQKAFDHYVSLAEQALEWGISPRCHFEDVTRADIYGFCIPFAQKLMELAKSSTLPVKIRLCDTMGLGVPYPGATLPRSVPRLLSAFTTEAGVPGEWLEWHGHNDFHKVLVNAVTAWMYGCGGANGTLLGFGERTGNAPVEGLVMEYISLTGEDDAANTRVITDIADYFSRELDYTIPSNYPFAGSEFNATSAGVHVDGLSKNEEIYNIFDTTLILNRPAPIIITDKSGRAGVAYWINHELKLEGDDKVLKNNPVVGEIYERIMQQYEAGRTTSFSNKEMRSLCRHYMPELFNTDLAKMKRIAKDLTAKLVHRLAEECSMEGTGTDKYPWMQDVVRKYPFIQYLHITDAKGILLAAAITDPAYKERYDKLPIGFDFSSRDWFQQPVKTGNLYVTDFYRSQFTDKLIVTVADAVTDDKDNIVGVVSADIQLEELLRRADELEDNANED